MKRTMSYVVAGAIALALMGCGATVDTANEAAPAAEATVEEASPRAAMTEWWEANKGDWKLMQQRLSAYDLAGAVDAMNDIDAMPDQGAQRLWVQYQRDLNLASAAYDMGDIATSTRYITKATPHMLALTDYIESLA
jgi:hypothetical protein